MNNIFEKLALLMEQQRKFNLFLLQTNSDLTDTQRKELAELHEGWEAGQSYGTNHYLRYGEDENGRAILYRTTRNISSATTPPNVPTNPQQYVKL
ncbi:MAG: hypothetical protein FWD23_07280 [Oscillospiraceae bacterium]|nr:hypothetical protein [Oscillospiraceae bacterium]